MKTILFVHASDELYGADVILLLIVNSLDQSEFDCLVVLPTDISYDGLLSQELLKHRVQIRKFRLAVLRRKYLSPLGLLSYTLALAYSTARLVTLVRAHRVDLVVSNTTAVIPGAIAARIAGRPHIWHVHEIIVRPRLIRTIISRIVPALSDRVIAVSRAVRDHLCATNEGARMKCRVIYNGIDTEAFHPSISGERIRIELGIDSRTPVVGMVGRVGSWKGQEVLLAAAEHVLARHPETHFVFTGGVFDGETQHLAHLRVQASKLGSGRNATVLDFRRDIPEILASLDIFVQPSTMPDPFPTTVLEAMAMGKPVIASGHGGPCEMVVHGTTGYLYPPNDPRALSDRICELIDDPEQRLSMGQAARMRVERDFSCATLVKQYSDLCREVIALHDRAHRHHVTS